MHCKYSADIVCNREEINFELPCEYCGYYYGIMGEAEAYIDKVNERERRRKEYYSNKEVHNGKPSTNDGKLSL